MVLKVIFSGKPGMSSKAIPTAAADEFVFPDSLW
jgi:hypothetical protein